MKTFFEWFEDQCFKPDTPWLIFGKGPSFAKRTSYDLSSFQTISLNHAVREQSVTLAHMIDLDVVDGCADVLEANAQFVVMPWIPHVKNKPTSLTLLQCVASKPVLQRLDQQGRLLWYNLSTAGEARPGCPVVHTRFFSAEAAINLLAMAGVKQIRSLGIDGGATYSKEFSDLTEKTLLANGRSSFNRQFEEIAKTIMKTNVDYAPLDVESPIRVYVATTEVQMLAVKVLEFSIRKHASVAVEVVPLHEAGVEIPMPKDAKNYPRTPFSFQRFVIPAVRGYKGRAIYLDSDMQVFTDIRQLWTLPFRGADVLAAREPGDTGRKPQFSVMLIDCERLQWDIREIVEALDSGNLSYEDLMYRMTVASNVQADIDPSWNSLERYSEGETALLHYTDMNTQPWVSRENPLGYLWFRDLFEAIDTGFISIEYVRDHVLKGYIRPSVMYQIENRIEDSFLLPKKARALDAKFAAPYQGIHRHGSSPWSNHIGRLRALARLIYQQTPLFRVQRRLREYWLDK